MRPRLAFGFEEASRCQALLTLSSYSIMVCAAYTDEHCKTWGLGQVWSGGMPPSPLCGLRLLHQLHKCSSYHMLCLDLRSTAPLQNMNTDKNKRINFSKIELRVFRDKAARGCARSGADYAAAGRSCRQSFLNTRSVLSSHSRFTQPESQAGRVSRAFELPAEELRGLLSLSRPPPLSPDFPSLSFALPFASAFPALTF